LTELRDRLAEGLDLRFGVLVGELIGLDAPMSDARTGS
jgi:MerR family copper efflux transcriptional regulator